jgi:PAS domain S-box-containing protein
MVTRKPTPGDPARRVAEMERVEAERRRAEQVLAASERRYRLLAECVSDIVWTANMDLRFTYVSPSVQRFIGYTPEELVGKSIVEHLTATASETAAQKFLEALALEEAGGTGSSTMVLQRLSKSGEVVFGEVTFALLRDAEGKPAEILGVTRDITRQQRAEEALRQSDIRLRTAVESLPLDFFVLDTDGRYVMQNASCTRHWGDLLGKRPEDLSIDARILAVWQSNNRRALAGEVVEGEDSLIRDGEERHYYNIISPVRDEDRIRGILGVNIDITERKRLEAELSKVERLESLGILASGIAHDFNNILTAVLANISMARAFGELKEDISKMLSDAENASLRARQLTQRLLTFAKGGAPRKETLSVAALLRETAEFALSGSKARCELSLPEAPWLVEADEGQIAQVIQNLMINADQAMPRGGTIRIHVENKTVDARDGLPLQPGRYLKVSLADEGSGIAAKDLPLIFDPFFTTKQKGSGLGLTTAFSIVKHHGGHIGVQSEPGAGTTFHIYLPASEHTVAGKKKDKAGPARGQGKVLMIDDAEAVRGSASRVLQRIGYQVEVARDHAEGIARYERALAESRPFDAVIMDLTIPGGMGGKEAVLLLQKIDRNLKAIASSGYSDDPVMSNYRSYGFSGAVAKPYTVEELAEVLLRVLRDAGAR